MAILKQTVTTVKIVDTDNFTLDEWKQFIKDNVAMSTILQVVRTDMFPLDKLKELALAGYKLHQELMGEL